MKQTEISFTDLLKKYFNINADKKDEQSTIKNVENSISFSGAQLWILIFAIFIACLGLNVNSTAVIIGAMLISPLMGPIMGFGLGLGINDFDLIKLSLRNFLMAIILSVITSTLFFFISPLSEAQSELLARTQPTLWDVLIAFFGGLAGIVAGSTKNKGNVIPGVAIATALMPPLCTAGFGLATGHLYYFFGAFYLFLINTVFIALATYLIVRLLKYPKKVFLDKQREKTVKRYVGVIVFFTIVPSIFLSYNLVQSTVFKEKVRSFVEGEFDFPDSQIMKREVTDTPSKREIKLFVLGEKLTDGQITEMRKQMSRYGLKNVSLVIHQGFGSSEVPDVNQLKSMVMGDFYKNNEGFMQMQALQIDSLKRELNGYKKLDRLTSDIVPEMKVLFPSVEQLSCARTYEMSLDSSKRDTVMLVYLKTKKKLSPADKYKMTEWLKAKSGEKQIKLLIE